MSHNSHPQGALTKKQQLKMLGPLGNLLRPDLVNEKTCRRQLNCEKLTFFKIIKM